MYFCRRCYAAADDDEPVDKGYGRSHGVACDLSHHGKRAACGVTVSRALAFGDVEYILRLERGVCDARELRVDALHGTYGHALLDHHVGHVLVLEAEGLDARVVSHVELAVADESESESRAEGVSQQVAVAFAAADLGQTVVYFGQGSRESLAIGIQVGIVIYIYGYSEPVVQEGAEGNAVTEGGEIGQMAADDAVWIVGGAGKAKLMATGGQSSEAITRLNPSTIVARQRSRSAAFEGSVIGSTTNLLARTAPNTKVVPPASSVMTVRLSFLYIIVSF